MNSKAERKNKTLIELVIAIMLNCGVTSHRWKDVLLTVFYVLKRVPKFNNNISPYEILSKIQPKLSYFRTWSCMAYVKIMDLK